MNAISGLEHLQKIVSGEIPQPPMAETMNCRLTAVNSGYAEFWAMAQTRHLNPMGGVHGGFACTVLDSVTGCAIATVLEPDEGYGTIDINVKMMRPIPVDLPLIAKSSVINRSRSLAVSEGRICDETGKIYAYASCTCKIFATQ